MPELPEVEALAVYLRDHAVGRTVQRVDVVALSALKTVEPPPSCLDGAVVADATRRGKFLDLATESGVHLVVHLARAGWLRWRADLPSAPPRRGAGPLALRVHLSASGAGAGRTAGFDVTEAGTRKRLAIYVVRSPSEVPGIARLGPDALDERLTPDLLGLLADGARVRVKGWLTDQSVIAGIGNAYSDEILHVARLSPFRIVDTLTPEELVRLHAAMTDVLADAVGRSVGQDAALLKAEKRTGLRVHARTGLPCPVCGDTVREVSYADRSFQYCATCQTGGTVLADRRMSRLLK